MHAGGKRFRPLLVLLAAETGDPTRDGVVTSACVVELTHLASLYHDDVMDEADLRRGAESANARWDNHVAILTGDFLFSKSSELTASLGADAVLCGRAYLYGLMAGGEAGVRRALVELPDRYNISVRQPAGVLLAIWSLGSMAGTAL